MSSATAMHGDIVRVFSFVFIQGFGREKDGNRGSLSVLTWSSFVIKNLKNSHCVNLLANRKSHLLFILSQSKVDM